MVWSKKVDDTKRDGDGELFAKAPPGNHAARLVAVIDLGMQKTEFAGEEKVQHRVYFAWELVNEKRIGNLNHVVGIDLTYSAHEKSKLRKWLEAWRGRKLEQGEDIGTLVQNALGKPCMVAVAENKNGYPVIQGIAQVEKTLKVPEAGYKPVIFSVDDGNEETLPAWLPYLFGLPLKEHIRTRVKHAEKINGNTVGEPKGDAHEPDTQGEIPF